ncbi:MAG TPA: hypothetical protein VK986_17215 [Tepidisphaeraceae bacterium]|nr:hypothetical protein [Tepidisphaeraceae bacterium]
MLRPIVTSVLAVAIALLVAAPAEAKQPKKYQVTGTVLEVGDDVIVVEKGEEKWEIAREAATKVTGALKVGAKVTIEYRMVAATAEVKEGGAAGADKPVVKPVEKPKK